MVPKGATHVFWQAVHAGAEKAAAENNLEIAWNAPALESDRSRQIAIVDSMINRRVDAMALAPVDQTALKAVVHRAIDSGIPVVIFDSALDSDRPISYIATDNREGGRVAARRMAEVTHGKGKIGIISDTPGSASTTERVNGFQEEMKAKFPAMELLPVQFVMTDRSKARAVTENLISANPDLAGIFADHEGAVTGSALALKSRGVHTVKLVGFDTSEQLVGYLKEGWIDSLVVQNPFRMGYETVRAIAMKLSGQTPAKQLDTGSTLVVSQDLDKPEIQKILFPDIETYLGKSGRK
jgi:ribose transport system substrate-binding protein